MEKPIAELVQDENAIAMGGRIFRTRCATCHGSDARGGLGYPNLTDDDWLHGGSPESIVQTITHGRNGVMPPFGVVIGGDAGVADVTEYVLSLSGREPDTPAASRGQAHCAAICSACHMPDGRGNSMMGSPNLADDVWLHGGRREDIARALTKGIVSQMPAHANLLSPERIHLAALYVYTRSIEIDP